MQRRQSLVRSEGRQSRTLFRVTIDGHIFMCGAVIVAECDQRPELKPQTVEPFRMIVFLQLILHHRAVLAMDHEHGLLDLDTLNFVGEVRKWIKAELLKILKPLRMNHAGIAVWKIKWLPFDEKGFLQLGEHDNAADRRFHGGHQQPVVTASIQPDDG